MVRTYREARDNPQITNEELFIKEKFKEVVLEIEHRYIKLSFEEYYKNIKELVKKYDFKCPEKPGTIPTKVSFNENEYSLIEETHCATCDSPMCQKTFQYMDYKDSGHSAFFYPILPVYTHNYQHELCALCLNL